MARRPTPLDPLVERLESASALDAPAKAAGRRVRDLLGHGRVKEAVSGTWLGHAAHPMLTDMVIGSFLSASLLDLLGGDDHGRARRRLVGAGIAAYVPTALTGSNDWADTEPVDDGIRRAGLAHAATNAVALWLYAGSLRSRRPRLLRSAGAAALVTASYVGGHLSFSRGVGPDQTVYDPGEEEWTRAGDLAALEEGRPVRRVAGDTPVLLLRRGDRILAIHDRCSHRGCSLSEGEVQGDEVTCACHGSRFDLRDGSLRHGPATAPQPAFDVRVEDGRVLVRRRS